MQKKEEFIIGMTFGGMLILVFYLLLYFPIFWLYISTPVEYRYFLKYILSIVFTVMLMNSARGAYQSLKIIKNHESVMKKIEESAEKNLAIQSYIQEGLKYRIFVELSIF